MGILYVAIKGLVYAVAYTIQCIGCSIYNGSLSMYKQQGAFSHSVQDLSSVEKTQLTKHQVKTFFQKEKIVCFDFLNTVFMIEREKCSSTIESLIFPANKNTVYTFDAIVRSLERDSDIKAGNVAVAMFHGKTQLWKKKDSDSWQQHAHPRKPIYNALHIAPVVQYALKRIGDWLRDPEGLIALINFLLNHDYKVAFYGFLQCPHLIPFTLKHIGLTEKQINNIYILCFNSNRELDIACMCGIYDIIPKLNGFKQIDYQLILGDRFYAYARRCGRSGNDSCQNQKVMHIAIPIFGSNIYYWDRLKKLLSALYNLIETSKKPEHSFSWQSILDTKLIGMGYTYKIIK